MEDGRATAGTALSVTVSTALCTCQVCQDSHFPGNVPEGHITLNLERSEQASAQVARARAATSPHVHSGLARTTMLVNAASPTLE